jgi:hypothetical protein
MSGRMLRAEDRLYQRSDGEIRGAKHRRQCRRQTAHAQVERGADAKCLIDAGNQGIIMLTDRV